MRFRIQERKLNTKNVRKLLQVICNFILKVFINLNHLHAFLIFDQFFLFVFQFQKTLHKLICYGTHFLKLDPTPHSKSSWIRIRTEKNSWIRNTDPQPYKNGHTYRLSCEGLGDPEPGVHALLDVSLQTLTKVLHTQYIRMRIAEPVLFGRSRLPVKGTGSGFIIFLSQVIHNILYFYDPLF